MAKPINKKGVNDRRVPIEVQGDHLERLARCPEASALAELIWNALDADATQVNVRFARNHLGGVEQIIIEDDGTGIGGEGHPADALFGRLGGSWKIKARRTRHHRTLHGKAGEGRFKAFALGDRVEWATRRLDHGRMVAFSIRGHRREASFSFSEEITTNERPGTIVTISEIPSDLRLDVERLLERLNPELALYLQQYSNAHVIIDGKQLNPSSVQVRRKDLEAFSIALNDGKIINVDTTIIEWASPRATRGLCLCDEHGFSLMELQPGIQAPGFSFTAYLKSAHFGLLRELGVLDSELAPGREQILEASKRRLRDYFRERAAEQARDAVARWQAEEIYPYDKTSAGPVERAERQVFDICALSLSDHLPDFDKSDVRQKKLAFRLLKEAIEQNPESLRTILIEVLGLPKDKQDELADLLRQTTLSAIINASKVITDRVRFLAGLEDLLFDPENKKRLLERRQLHRILATNTWIWGEQYNLTVDDESLNAALARHLELLGRSSADASPVLREDGSEGVLDLMLSRSLPLPHHDKREHLVIELKRPSQPVDDRVLQQIDSYARAVVKDDRFRDTHTVWRFIAVSDAISESVADKAGQENRPRGLVFNYVERKTTVWALTWSQVIEEARARLEFFKRALEYNVSKESAQDHLRQVYAKYLPGALTDAHPKK